MLRHQPLREDISTIASQPPHRLESSPSHASKFPPRYKTPRAALSVRASPTPNASGTRWRTMLLPTRWKSKASFPTEDISPCAA